MMVQERKDLLSNHLIRVIRKEVFCRLLYTLWPSVDKLITHTRAYTYNIHTCTHTIHTYTLGDPKILILYLQLIH